MIYRKHVFLSCGLFIFLAVVSNAEAKKNVILIIPDGCSSVMWTAIRAMTVGTEGLLNVDRLPVQGRCRTYSADAIITDSAAGGTAYATGIKTNNGVLGMSASTTLGDSLSGKPVPTILELAEKAGYASGLISTAYIQHATPAAF
ncbi:MAG: alkaline phosphatase, partial [Candidatus Latescibacterota bacterium]